MLKTARFLLLLITLAAVGTIVLWRSAPEFISNQVDPYLKRLHTRSTSKALEEATALLKDQQTDEALAVLDDALASLHDVQLNDRLHLPHRQLMGKRTEILDRLGRLDEALDQARTYAKHAPRDLKNMLTIGRILTKMPGRKQEAEQHFRRVFELVPEWAPGTAAFTSFLIGEGRRVEAIDAGLEYARRVRWQHTHDYWKTRWSDAGQTSTQGRFARDRLRDLGGGVFELVTQLPPGTGSLHRVGVDFPVSAQLRLRDWELSVEAGGQMSIINDPKDLEKRSQIRVEPDGALASPEVATPRISAILPARPLRTEGATIRLRAVITPTFPAALRTLFASPGMWSEVHQRLSSEGRGEDLQLLRYMLSLEEGE